MRNHNGQSQIIVIVGHAMCRSRRYLVSEIQWTSVTLQHAHFCVKLDLIASRKFLDAVIISMRFHITYISPQYFIPKLSAAQRIDFNRQTDALKEFFHAIKFTSPDRRSNKCNQHVPTFSILTF